MRKLLLEQYGAPAELPADIADDVVTDDCVTYTMKPITETDATIAARVHEIESRERGIGPANDSISPAERRRREDAASFALANVRLSGFQPSQQALQEVRRHINGEITLSELFQVTPNAAPAPSR
jgi:hypothetical protein